LLVLAHKFSASSSSRQQLLFASGAIARLTAKRVINAGVKRGAQESLVAADLYRFSPAWYPTLKAPNFVYPHFLPDRANLKHKFPFSNR